MKNLNLYKIKEMALKSKMAVYSIQQLANLIGKPKSVANVYASRLVNKGMAKKLLQGKITFIDDDQIIASQLIEPAYISLSSALLFYNMITQVPTHIECVTPKNSIRYKDLGVVYHKIPSSLFFGYDRFRKGESYILIADREKALVDAVYLNLVPKTMIQELVNSLDKNKLERYIKRFRGRGRKKLERWLL